VIKLPPMDADERWKYSDEEWLELAKAWAKEAPELKSAADEIRKYFPDAKVTYIGPARK